MQINKGTYKHENSYMVIVLSDMFYFSFYEDGDVFRNGKSIGPWR